MKGRSSLVWRHTSGKKNAWKVSVSVRRIDRRCRHLFFCCCDLMEETVSITHHSSLAVSQNRFIFFSSFQWRFIPLPRSRPADVLSDCYRCVIEHALWERTRSVWRQVFSGAVSRNALATLSVNANAFSSTSGSINPVVPRGPRGPRGQDMPYLNTESLSVKFHTINSIEDSQKLLTVKLSAPSLLHAPPACSSLS